MIFLNLIDIGRQIRVPIVAPGQMSACNTSEIWPPLPRNSAGGNVFQLAQDPVLSERK